MARYSNAPNSTLDSLSLCLQNNLYTRAVLLCASWAEVSLLVDWLKLSPCRDVFTTYFHR